MNGLATFSLIVAIADALAIVATVATNYRHGLEGSR